MTVTVRPGTAEDIRAVAGGLPGTTVRAWAFDVDGEVAAIAGWFVHAGIAHVFSDIREDVMVPKITVWRAALDFMDRVQMPALCVACDGSGAFLRRLGWQVIGQHDEGEVYAWQI